MARRALAKRSHSAPVIVPLLYTVFVTHRNIARQPRSTTRELRAGRVLSTVIIRQPCRYRLAPSRARTSAWPEPPRLSENAKLVPKLLQATRPQCHRPPQDKQGGPREYPSVLTLLYQQTIRLPRPAGNTNTQLLTGTISHLMSYGPHPAPPR